MNEQHDHRTGFLWPEPDVYGWPVNGPAISQLIGAGVDQCAPCQTAAADEIAADPHTTARMVLVGAATVADMCGGTVPYSLFHLNNDGGLVSREFRTIMAAGARAGDTAGDHDRMPVAAAEMTAEQRRRAVDAAADFFAAGVLHATVEQAAEFIAAHAGDGHAAGDVLTDRSARSSAFRAAARTLHPDRGGSDAEQFRLLTAARAILDQHAAGVLHASFGGGS